MATRQLQRFRFDIDGDVEYSRAFAAAADEVDDMSDPLREVGESLRLAVSEQFRTEGAAGLGSRWQPLNPDYAAWKQSQVGDQPILVFTGTMRDAMTDPRALIVGPRQLVYQPDHPDYAPRHQRGEGVPERKMVALAETVRRSWDRIFATWLNDIRRGPLWR